MMQAPAYCFYCYCVGSLHIGSLHPLGIWLRDLCIMYSPRLQIMLVTTSVVNGGGVVREHVCSCADTWADMATCQSTPLGSTSW